MKQPELELPPDATMPQFCDVAVAGPFDLVFTYRIPDGMAPVVGGRVLVPFRQQRVSGIVTELHERTPKVAAKNVISVLDAAPVLDDQLLRLGRWIADYYLAPLGEVFRTMLPLGAEFKRSIGYGITDAGRTALHLAGVSGSSARSRRTPQEQLSEFRALDYLGEREMVRKRLCAPPSAFRNPSSPAWFASNGLSAKTCLALTTPNAR